MGVHRGRFSAEIEGDFVVFLIGMRFNKPWKVRELAPVLAAMPKMLKVLGEHETYKVRAGEYEAVYANMPVFGLARAGTHTPVGRQGESAAIRIGANPDDIPAVDPY